MSPAQHAETPLDGTRPSLHLLSRLPTHALAGLACIRQLCRLGRQAIRQGQAVGTAHLRPVKIRVRVFR